MILFKDPFATFFLPAVGSPVGKCALEQLTRERNKFYNHRAYGIQDLFLASANKEMENRGFPGGSLMKSLPVNAGDMGLDPSFRRPHCGETSPVYTTATEPVSRAITAEPTCHNY